MAEARSSMSLLTPKPARRVSPARLLLPVLAAGLVMACVLVLLRTSRSGHTVSQVKRGIHTIALHRSTEPDRADGGPLGPWWIAADGVDPVTGVLENFHVSSGNMEIAARGARLTVDPVDDTFTFELLDVAFTRVPDPDASEPEPEGLLVSKERYVLGPAPYGVDIVSD
jgi:hypothetical protein